MKEWRTDQRCPICHNQFKSDACKHSYAEAKHFHATRLQGQIVFDDKPIDESLKS